MNQSIEQLRARWLELKSTEDTAKSQRIEVEDQMLKAIGYEGQADFKNYKDDQIKIGFTKKEVYDNDKLLSVLGKFSFDKMFSDPGFPFRIKLEPDAKKMVGFKYEKKAWYDENLLPIMEVKIQKPSFAATNKAEGPQGQSWNN